MTAVLFMSQNGNKAQENADVAARQVAAQLRSLQNESLNGKQTGTITTIACDFNFDATNGDTSYTISYKDCDFHSHIAGADQVIKLNSGKGNVTISNPSGSAVSVSFGASWGNLLPGFTSQITLTSNGKNAYVCVCGPGNIFDTKVASCGC